MPTPDVIERVIDGIIAREGGYVHHPLDRGGPTNFGITMPTLAAWRRREVIANEIRDLTVDQARAIYRDLYASKWSMVDDERLFEFLVDCQVNHRPETVVRFIQRALGVKVDGVFGPATRAALTAAPDMAAVYRTAVAERVRFYGRLITKDRTQAVFAAGWMNRVAEFVERAT